MATFSRTLAAWIFFLAIGLALTHSGTTTWDSLEHLARSDWLLARFHLPTNGHEDMINPILMAYGPLWALLLGLFALPLQPLHDPSWFQNGFNFTLFPLTLLYCFCFLRRAGYERATCALAAATLLSIIRLGGHSLSNVVDFPLACLFLISALLNWRVVERDADRPVERAVAAFVAIAVFLVRPPMLLPLAILNASTLFLLKRLSLRRRIAETLASWIALIAISYAIWPMIWDQGLAGFIKIGGLFSRFPISYGVRLYGSDFVSDKLPFYYTLVWFPLVVTPAALATIIIGLWGHAKRGLSRRSLPTWLCGTSLAAWAAILVLHPSLYDEDRHFLFLFPPLVLAAALGCDLLSKKWRWGLAAACAATALAAYAQWGRYSYVYRNPLAGPTTSQDFMGDYWGSCVSPAVRGALASTPESGGLLIVPGPALNAKLALSRLPGGERLLVGSRAPGPPTQEQPLFVLVTNRLGGHHVVLHDIERGLADRVDIQTMPGGEIACVVARYPAKH